MPSTVGPNPPPSHLDTAKKENPRKESIKRRLKGWFIKQTSSAEKQIPPPNKKLPSVSSKMTKFSLLRGAGRANSWTKKQQLVHPIPVMEISVPSVTEKRLTPAQTDSYLVSDEKLASLTGATDSRVLKEPDRIL